MRVDLYAVEVMQGFVNMRRIKHHMALAQLLYSLEMGIYGQTYEDWLDGRPNTQSP